MSKSSILVTRRLPASAVALLKTTGDVHVLDSAPDAAALRQAVAGRAALVSMLTDKIDEALLEAAGPSLKVVANVAVGFDNVDLAAAREHHVVVTNTPDVLTNSVAEFTWALILAVARRLVEGDRLIRRKGWTGWSFDFMTGTELAGKQLGILGPGRIGRAVAARAAAFGMTVAFGRHRDETTIDGHPVVSFDELLVSSDVLSVNVPLRPDTKHLIDRRTLARMKRTAYLINTARGPVIDEEALAWALKDGLIAGAALDVFEREPHVHPDLLDLENVVLAPHIGSATSDTRRAMAELAAKNVVAVLSDQPALTEIK